LRSANLSKIYTNVNISKSFFSLLTGICLYSFFALEEWSFILGQALVMGIILSYLSSYVNKNTDLYWLSKSDEFDKKNIKIFGFYAAFINIFTILLSGADRFIIKYFLGDEMVAIYSANYDLAEKSIFFINSLLILSSSSTVIKLFDISGEKIAVEYLSKLRVRIPWSLSSRVRSPVPPPQSIPVAWFLPSRKRTVATNRLALTHRETNPVSKLEIAFECAFSNQLGLSTCTLEHF
jgi:hypothetical protein